MGYSFNDEFIRNSFREILEDMAHKLIIVDPNASDIANTLR